MKKRIHLKPLRQKKKHSKTNILLFSIVLVILATFGLLHFIGNILNPTLVEYAEIETKRLATNIINHAVTKNVTDVLEDEELFDITKTSTGEIQTVDFNSAIVNKVLQFATNTVQEQLKYLENGEVDKIELPNTLKSSTIPKLKEGIVCEIPFGVVTGNSLLANIGPKFPVRLSFVGDVLGNVNTKINSYGINNAIVEISIHVEVTEQIIMPLVSKEIPISIDIPVAIKMVQGKVPTYYQNGLDKNSNIFSLPMQ